MKETRETQISNLDRDKASINNIKEISIINHRDKVKETYNKEVDNSKINNQFNMMMMKIITMTKI